MLKPGNILSCSHTYIVHQTNCESPYARGLAQAIFLAFPWADTYSPKKGCTRNPGEILISGDGKKQRFVINFNAQRKRGKPNSTDDTKEMRLTWFQECLDALRKVLKKGDLVAFPWKIGCVLGGGNWADYQKVLETFQIGCSENVIEILHPILLKDECCKILVCGDRNYTDYKMLKETMNMVCAEEKKIKQIKIIHGGCKGADLLAEKYAQEVGLKSHSFPAEWAKYGRAAGPFRNQEMILQKPEVVIAFHKKLAESKGTRSMMMIALKAKVPLFWINDKGKMISIQSVKDIPTLQSEKVLENKKRKTNENDQDIRHYLKKIKKIKKDFRKENFRKCANPK